VGLAKNIFYFILISLSDMLLATWGREKGLGDFEYLICSCSLCIASPYLICSLQLGGGRGGGQGGF